MNKIFTSKSFFNFLEKNRSNNSKSARNQDYFALYCNHNTSGNKYFVEFGGGDGEAESNTWLLEKDYGWTGVLAECNKACLENFNEQRTCKLIQKALYGTSNQKLEFTECDIVSQSTLSETAISYKDHCYHNRINSQKKYEVETISLEDLLIEVSAPKTIDFMSCDTEGSEYDILKNFDFKKYFIKCITVEHNYTNNQVKIFGLLTRNNYVRVLSQITDTEDWYVHRSLFNYTLSTEEILF